MLIEGAKALGLDLPVQAQQRLLDYVALIEKWNKVYNLTAIRDPEHMVVEHLLDSLAVSPHTASGTVLDLGSGAGLPGIPLSIARPDLQVTLLDSNRKKCAFLKQVTIELGLGNIEVACVRAEVFRPGHGFESVLSRAFADLATIAALGAPLLAPGGRLLAMKGAEPADELAQLGAAVRVQSVVRLDVPGLGAQRHLVIMTMA
jgi:16S rRNA (guanine527-N7)-methyltransferase